MGKTKSEILPYLVEDSALHQKIVTCTEPQDLVNIIQENLSTIMEKVPAKLFESSPEEEEKIAKEVFGKTNKTNK